MTDIRVVALSNTVLDPLLLLQVDEIKMNKKADIFIERHSMPMGNKGLILHAHARL